MILKITNKCMMGCNHCMMHSSPTGEHMNIETFNKAINLIKQLNPVLLMISGGEPTEHPDFFDILDTCTNLMGRHQIIVASNGMFLVNKKITKKLMNKKVCVQITNDERYYPKSINRVDYKKFLYEDNIRQVTNHGRARLNNIGDKSVKPKCYNIISVAKSVSSLEECINLMERQVLKFCTMSINWDGSITVGESIECKCIGTVDDSLEVLFNNLKSLDSNSCNKCSGWNNLNVIEKLNIDLKQYI